MRSGRPEPENPVQPLRVIAHREAHEDEAREAGVEDLVEFRAIYTREVLLHVAIAGPEDGEPVVLLHGFPDIWMGWSHQIRPLVEAGYRVIMPDQRGYNLSEKPQGIDAYELARLGPDILDVVEALGYADQKVHLVGHDWGGAVSWWLAGHHREQWSTLTILNCPPAEVMLSALREERRQLMRSWYVVLFQLPKLPEVFASARDFRLLEAAIRKASAPVAFTAGELKEYRRAWGQEGAIRGMINWYRAARRGALGGSTGAAARVRVPTTIIWGKKDVALHPLLVERSAAGCDDVEVEWIEHAGHWVHREAPELVAEKMLASFRRSQSD